MCSLCRVLNDIVDTVSDPRLLLRAESNARLSAVRTSLLIAVYTREPS